MPNIPMTAGGKQRLQEELKELKEVKRPEISAAIGAARALGDLKENGEYHAAREQQAFIEGRINYLEALLSNAEVIDIGKIPNTGRVIFGVTVDLEDINTEKSLRYQIVGEEESNVKLGKISLTSPLARALIGKEEGDIIDVETPTGLASYEIIKVHHIVA